MSVTENGVVYSEQLFEEWERLFKQYEFCYLGAMLGYGKTSTALAFANKNYALSVRISACEPDFFARLNMAPSVRRDGRRGLLCILDDLQELTPQQQARLAKALPGICGPHIRFFLLSRGPMPKALESLHDQNRLVVLPDDVLRFDRTLLYELFDVYGVQQQLSSALVDICMHEGRGNAMILRQAALCVRDGCTAPMQVKNRVLTSFGEYLDEELLPRFSAELRTFLFYGALFTSFETSLMDLLLPSGNTAAALREALHKGNFLRRNSDGSWRIVRSFRSYLYSRCPLTTEERMQIYRFAGDWYTRQERLVCAAKCYAAGNARAELMDTLCTAMEQADGSCLPHELQTLFEKIPFEMAQAEPRFLAAKTLQLSYQRRIDESDACLSALRQQAYAEDAAGHGGRAMECYVRIAPLVPHRTSRYLLETLRDADRLAVKYQLPVGPLHITGNMPSVLNGGADFYPMAYHAQYFFPRREGFRALAWGDALAGCAETALGEYRLEQNRRGEALNYLIEGLTTANQAKQYRMAFAAAGVLARLYLVEGDMPHAVQLLEEQRATARAKEPRLLSAIQCARLECALYENDRAAIERWRRLDAPRVLGHVFLSDRLAVWTAAKVNTALGNTGVALTLLTELHSCAVEYHRRYLWLQCELLSAVLHYRRGEEWMDMLCKTAKECYSCHLMRIVADFGTALLPLWKDAEFERRMDADGDEAFRRWRRSIRRELLTMAAYYPGYLAPAAAQTTLTDREMEALMLVAQGLSNAIIAEKLGLTMAAVKFRLTAVYRKLGVSTRSAALREARARGLLK